MSKPKSILIKAAVAIAMAVTAYLALLSFPQPLFAYSFPRIISFSIPITIPKRRRRACPASAAAKLATSPLYSANQTYDIFICNARWRQRLFLTETTESEVLPHIHSPRTFSPQLEHRETTS